MTELLSRELLHEYPVLYEKQGELVAHFKSTVLLTANGSDQLSAFPVQNLDTDGKQVEDEEIKQLMAQSIKKSKRKGGKKKKKKAAEAAA